MVKVKIDQDRCKGCGLCTLYCPRRILALSAKVNENSYHPAVVTEPEKCISCLSCYLICPDGCYQVYREGMVLVRD